MMLRKVGRAFEGNLEREFHFDVFGVIHHHPGKIGVPKECYWYIFEGLGWAILLDSL